MFYLAIDQHSKQLTVNLRNEAGNILVRRQVSTRGEAPRQFLEDVRQRSLAEGGYVTIVEVCGFNDWLLELLPTCGCRETVLVQADRRSKRKTDRRDASWVSCCGSIATGCLPVSRSATCVGCGFSRGRNAKTAGSRRCVATSAAS